jgi:hypothetical protein
MSKFSVGEKINTESLGAPMTLWLKAAKPRFFLLLTKLGRNKTRSAVYLMASAVCVSGKGTTFQLVKLFGHKKFPNIAVLNGGEPLAFDAEVFDDAETLCEKLAQTLPENEKQTVLNVEALLSIRS